MINSMEASESSAEQESHPGVSATEIRNALSAILLSVPFRSSLQAQKLLQFLVNEALAGRAETLKERNVGTSVFGRRPDYDTNSDPIVRLRVGELRKRLALYYQTTPTEAVRISVPLGAFRPVFEAIGAPPAASQAPELTQPPAGQMSPPGPLEISPSADALPGKLPNNRRLWVAITGALLIVALVALHFMPTAGERALNRFWSPILDDLNPVLIHLGNNTVYELTPSFRAEYYKQHPLDYDQQSALQDYYPMHPATEDLFRSGDFYHNSGDVTALVATTSLLARRNRSFDVRYAGDLTYGDVRHHPTVLIGGHNNAWTMRMTRNLRFSLDGQDAIVDHFDPRRRWVANPDRTEDYAIVSRILDSSNERAFIAFAGIGHEGTSAAAAFAGNPDSLGALAKSLPRGWEKKNLQIVLRTRVKDQVADAPDVVATYTW